MRGRPDGVTHALGPEGHVALYRVERVGSGADGKIIALYLHVHLGEPFTHEMMAVLFSNCFKTKKEAGELGTSGNAFGILQFGLEISFYTFRDDKLQGMGRPDGE